MNKKTLLTSLLLLCMSIVGFAQKERGEVLTAPSKNQFLLKDPLWFISVGLGGQLYEGEDDNGVPGNRTSYLKRTTLAPTLSIGRRLSNVVSLRLQFSGGSLHGYNDGYFGTYAKWGKQGSTPEDMKLMTKDPQWDYMGWEEGKQYWFKDGMYMPIGWGANTEYYMQHLRYFSGSADISVNLINMIKGYSPNRKFELSPFGGLGVYQRFAHMGNTTGTYLAASFGLTAGVNLTRNWQVFAEGRGVIVNDEFDGQIGDMSNNGIAQATLGITYKFGEPRYIDPALETRYNIPYNIAKASDDMVLVPGGNIELGTGVDPIWGDQVPRKLVAVSPFWMDQTEVTNRQYREFVYWVRDSIIRERLADVEYGGDASFAFNTKSGKKGINWNKSIPWKNPTARQASAINSVVGEEAYKVNEAGIKTYVLPYKYDWYDARSHQAYLNNPNRDALTISKDTAYVTPGGEVICKTLTRKTHGDAIDFTNTYIVNVYPDVMAWTDDFANAKSDQYAKNYFTSSAYDNFPVVGVSWEQADAYCAWRTDRYLAKHGRTKGFDGYRLPTEAEWEYAARNGRSEMTYPWESNKTHTSDGLAHANYRGSKDLKDIVSPVATFLPNRFGLFDMAGNVAEWTSTTFTESTDRMSDDINPDYSYRAVNSDPDALKRKIYKGGSWKDNTIKPGDRTAEYQNKARSYIGFRCIRNWDANYKK